MSLFRRRRGEPAPPPATPTGAPAPAPEPEPEPVAPHDTLLAEAVAGHFDTATVAGATVHLGFGEASVECHVDSVLPAGGETVAASLFFWISSPRLGGTAVFASVSGYEANAEAAIITGACNWTCALGTVLRAGLTGEPADCAEELTAQIGGRPYRVVLGALDRDFLPDGGAEGLSPRVRERLGGEPWLTTAVLTSDVLPVLPARTSTILSTFVGEGPTQRIVEVKVNGVDWAPGSRAFPQPLDESEPGWAMLRELAVLTPLGAPVVPGRDALDRTLAGLGVRDEPERAAGWRGWRTHRGLLAPPMDEGEVAGVEARIGPLDAEHRAFLTSVAAAGAGPGYGLLRPHAVGDVLPLAHAGCGVVWVLRLDAAHRGEVWCDARSADGSYVPVAGSFLGWYLDWVDAAVRDASPWLHWDSGQCATQAVLSQLLSSDAVGGVADLSAAARPRSLSLLSGGDEYLPAGTALDPCHGCVTLVARLGLIDEVFARGVLGGDVPPSP